MTDKEHPHFEDGVFDVGRVAPSIYYVSGHVTDAMPGRQLLTAWFHDIFRSVQAFIFALTEMIVSTACHSIHVHHELPGELEIGFQGTWSLIRIERSCVAKHLNVRRLEATKDDSTWPCKHALGPIETPAVSSLQDVIYCFENRRQDTAIIVGRQSNRCSDLVLLEPAHMVNDAGGS